MLLSLASVCKPSLRVYQAAAPTAPLMNLLNMCKGRQRTIRSLSGRLGTLIDIRSSVYIFNCLRLILNDRTVDGRGLGDLPDPLKAVQAIQANLGEKVYSVQQAPTKLFPAKYTDPKANYRFDDMIKSLDANIVYLRQIILQHTNVDIDAWDGTSDMWKGFVTSVEGHKEMREADEWDKELSNVKNGFTQAGHTPFTKTVTSSVDGRTTWTELDPVQILPNSGMNGASYIHLVDTSKSAQSASHTR